MSKLKTIRDALDGLGVVVTETPEGEYRVFHRNGRRAQVFFANSVDEAIAEGRVMAAPSQPPAPLTYTIQHDPDCESPLLGDTSVRLVVLHRKYADPAKGMCGSSKAEIARWAADNHAKWFTVPLWLAEAQGKVAMRAGRSDPFGVAFDSACVGFVALDRAAYPKNDEALLHAARTWADSYTEWLDGSCYGYQLTNGDSRWGFIGREACEDAAREAVLKATRIV